MELSYLIDKATTHPQTEARPVSNLLAISIRTLSAAGTSSASEHAPCTADRPSNDCVNTD